MNILMVLDREFPPDIRVENEISALITAGHEIHLACYTRKNKPAFEKNGKLNIYRKSISTFLYKSSVAHLTLPFYNIFWHSFLSQILKNQKINAIHVHDLPLVGLGIRLKNKFNIKLTADLHENWPAFVDISKHTNTLAGKVFSPVFLWRKYEKRVLQKVDQVIVVVEEARTRLTNLGINGSKIHVVSNTLNFLELKIRETKNPTGNILYYAGGINYHRGLQYIIRAMEKSNNKKLIFWILGEGSYREELEKLVKALSLDKQVIFQGYKSFNIVMEMLSEADFAVIPHIKNEHTDSTIPHKLFQYMFLRKPVIASDCLPIKRILEETGSGIVYPYDQVEQLAGIFDHLNNFDLVKMGYNGETAVRNKYNWDNDSKILAAIYQN